MSVSGATVPAMESTPDLTVRAITDDEVADWSQAVGDGFLSPGGRADAEFRRPALLPNRTLAGFDGSRVVSTFRSFPSVLTLPGGTEISTDAITAVTVLGSHRRRGLASRMMRYDLEAALEREEKSAILIAAEWPIYGRFGFGAGTQAQSWTVDATVARIARPQPGRVDFVEAEEGAALGPILHATYRRQHPGEWRMRDRMWQVEFGLLHPPSWDAPKKHFTVVAKDEHGEPIGLARFRHEDKWTDGVPRGVAVVPLFLSTSPQATSLLLQFLIELDWIGTVKLERMPADGLIDWLLVDARHAVPSGLGDFLWWRPLDIPHVLSARSYPSPGELVLQVHDPLGLSGGTFLLEGAPEGGSCTPTTRTPQVSLPISALASVALGGYKVSTLAAAGLIEGDRRAVTRADDLFRCRRTPFSHFMF